MKKLWHETVEDLYKERISSPSLCWQRQDFNDEFYAVFVDNISDLNKSKAMRLLSVMGIPFVCKDPIFRCGEKQLGCTWFFASPENKERARKALWLALATKLFPKRQLIENVH